MRVITAPHKTDYSGHPVVFLAGSMQPEWRQMIIEQLQSYSGLILNPYHENAPLVKSIEFEKQVEWELDGLSLADIVFVHFDVNTTPNTLIELGYLFNTNTSVFVSCGNDFWQRDYIKVLCNRCYNSNLFLYNDINKALDGLIFCLQN